MKLGRRQFQHLAGAVALSAVPKADAQTYPAQPVRLTAALAEPKIKTRILDLGGVPMPMSPAEFGRFLAAETEKWAKVIRAADIKPG